MMGDDWLRLDHHLIKDTTYRREILGSCYSDICWETEKIQDLKIWDNLFPTAVLVFSARSSRISFSSITKSFTRGGSFVR